MLIKYPLSRNLPFSEITINELGNSTLTDEEKLYGYLYYFSEHHSGMDVNKLDADENFRNILEHLKSKSSIEFLSVSALEEFNLWIYNYEIVRRLVVLVNNPKLKEELLIFLFENLKDIMTIDSTEHDLMLSNVLARVIKDLPNSYLDKINKYFDD